MDSVIRQIMAIDNKAGEIIKRTEEYLEKSERDIRASIELMRKDVMEKTRNESKALYDSIVKEAEEEAERIKKGTEEECNTIGSKFKKVDKDLENQLFSRIFR